MPKLTNDEVIAKLGLYGWQWSPPDENGVRDVLVIRRDMTPGSTDRTIIKRCQTIRDAMDTIDHLERDWA